MCPFRDITPDVVIVICQMANVNNCNSSYLNKRRAPTPTLLSSEFSTLYFIHSPPQSIHNYSILKVFSCWNLSIFFVYGFINKPKIEMNASEINKASCCYMISDTPDWLFMIFIPFAVSKARIDCWVMTCRINHTSTLI